MYRIVGFVEYVEAIQLLDTFVEEATAAELEVADELIKSHDEYRIATNLSRPIEKPSALSESPLNPRDDFSRHGLEWVLALARVEVGAMLAGFTSHENPFLALAPTVYRQERVKTLPYGSAAFAEMLMDGLRTHYWSIASGDLIANYYKNGVPENHLLTYGRRAIVGRHFLKAVLAYTGAGNSGQNLPPEQKKELEKWEQTFIKLQRIMLYCLTFKVGTQKTTHYHVGMAREAHLNWIGIERDQTPDAIRRILTTADPTLIGCGCK